MLPYIGNQGRGLHAVKVRQEKQPSVSGALELLKDLYHGNHQPPHQRFPPGRPPGPESPMWSICQHLISWFGTSATGLILASGSILSKAVQVRGTSYYTMENINSPNPYCCPGETTLLFTSYKQGEVQDNELIVHKCTMWRSQGSHKTPWCQILAFFIFYFYIDARPTVWPITVLNEYVLNK